MVRRIGLGLTLLGALCALQGCARPQQDVEEPGTVWDAVLSYLQHRGEDALETVDIGFTWSSKPQVALFGNFSSITPGGYGCVDGYFAGIGGGRAGVVRHYERSIGVGIWGYEEIGWGEEFDKDDITTLTYAMGTGVLGLVLPPYGRPASAPS